MCLYYIGMARRKFKWHWQFEGANELELDQEIKGLEHRSLVEYL